MHLIFNFSLLSISSYRIGFGICVVFLYRYKVDTIIPAKTSVDPRVTSLYTKTADLVGIDEPREELITRLTKGDDMSMQQRIVSVVGFGGLARQRLPKQCMTSLRGNLIAQLLFRLAGILI